MLKTHLAVRDDPHVFATPDALVTLGASRSAVASMRFWSSAFKLTDGIRHQPGTASDVLPTARARWLLHEDGDSYLEEDKSLWLLHWWLLAPPCLVPAWFYTFCLSPLTRLEPDRLRAGIERAAAAASWKRQPTSTTLHRDISCMVRMYTPGTPHEQPRATFEDLVDRPFSVLRLLNSGPDGVVRLSSSAGAAAPAAIVAYACLEYASRFTPGPGSISVGRLLTDDAGPGRVLRLPPRSLSRALTAAAVTHPQLRLTHNGDGIEVLTYSCPPLALAWNILDASYGHVRRRLGIHPEQGTPGQPTERASAAEQLALDDSLASDGRRRPSTPRS
ncbi:DUF4007 family protein [Streptomyces sp. NPDC005784]|uniref:DUF4007 family protein n=1 Tax=Streptomyces sp. NPDC005784 TaxID=3364731 RepID=UPI0036A499FC